MADAINQGRSDAGVRLGKKLLLLTLSVFAATTFAGNYCLWTGAGKDGKWGTAANWETVPVSGQSDVLVFEGDEPLAIENDLENLSIGGIITRGNGAKTFNGNEVALSGNCIGAMNNGGTANARSYSISNACETIFNLDFQCVGNVALCADANPAKAYVLTFNGKFSISDGKTLRVGDAYAYNRDRGNTRTMTFNGEISGPNATLQLSCWNQPATFNGAIDVNKLTYDYTKNVYLPADAGSLRVRSGSTAMFYALPHFRGSDLFGAYPIVLDWANSYYEKGMCSWMLDGHSQTIDRLGPSFYNDKTTDDVGNAIDSSTPATLTMKATADSSTFGVIKGKVSLVWDPQGDYMLEFKRRASVTSGSIDIRRGEFRLSDGATMPNVPSLKLGPGTVLTLSDPPGPCFKSGANSTLPVTRRSICPRAMCRRFPHCWWPAIRCRRERIPRWLTARRA